MNVFGTDSRAKLAQLHPDLVRIAELAIISTPFDWRIVQTARTIAQQREYFLAGKSKVNPDAYPTPEALYAAAKHVVGPGAPLARAMDVAIVGKDPYNVPSLMYLSGVIRRISIELGIPIRQGCDFDRDGLLNEAGTFIDLPHHELDF